MSPVYLSLLNGITYQVWLFRLNYLALNNVMATELYFRVREIICGRVRLPGVICVTLNLVNDVCVNKTVNDAFHLNSSGNSGLGLMALGRSQR